MSHYYSNNHKKNQNFHHIYCMFIFNNHVCVIWCMYLLFVRVCKCQDRDGLRMIVNRDWRTSNARLYPFLPLLNVGQTIFSYPLVVSGCFSQMWPINDKYHMIDNNMCCIQYDWLYNEHQEFVLEEYAHEVELFILFVEAFDEPEIHLGSSFNNLYGVLNINFSPSSWK